MGSRGFLTFAWLFGIGLISWRDVKDKHRPPMAGQLIGASGLFALLAVLAEADAWAPVAAALAGGFDLAVFLQLKQIPPFLGGPAGPPAKKGGGIQNVPNQPVKAGP